MSEVLVKYDEAIEVPETGERYFAQAVAGERSDKRWEGWLEFLPTSEDAETIVSERETTQPNRVDVEYWAQGLTRVYLQGALSRAIRATQLANSASEDSSTETASSATPAKHAFASGSPQRTAPLPRPILDPYSVYAQGEHILRSELSALSHGHVESIVDAYGFSPQLAPGDLASQPQDKLIEAIVEGVRSGAP